MSVWTVVGILALKKLGHLEKEIGMCVTLTNEGRGGGFL